METVAPISVAEYHRMIEAGEFGPTERLELINGFIVAKLPMNNPHRTALIRLHDLLRPMVPTPWILQNQCPITLSESEPEPDLCAYLPDPLESFYQRHAGPSECGLVVEVSDSTLAFDRSDKLEIYARDRVSTYWILNIPDRCIEVYEVPNGTREEPIYKTRRVYAEGESVPVFLAGNKKGEIAVTDILPRK